MNKYNLSKKRLIIIFVFLGIFVIGTIFMFITPFSVKSTYGLTTTTDDGVIISFNVFEPQNGGSNKPAFIIGHGSMVNKEMVKGYAVELAAAGFVAVPFDFRGHGQSSDGERDDMYKDIIAIKAYLSSRGDIDMNSLGYIGYSMGGLGQTVIQNDSSFICFIGIGTWLDPTLRTGNSTNPLHVLMIQAIFDEAVELSDQKESVSIRAGIPIADVDANKIYGSFIQDNATMIYLDDDSNHLKVAWDADFIRVARDWAINAFQIDVVDENFYGNLRAIILFIQIFGGIGLFFAIVDPISKLILLSKQERGEEREIKFFRIESTEISLGKLSIQMIVYSLLLAIPGILIFFPLLLILPLAIAGFVVTLLFGQTFSFLVLLWRLGKKTGHSIKNIFKTTFESRAKFLRELILGLILATILYLVAYLSIGLNYLALLPSLMKVWTIPIFFAIMFFINLVYSMIMQFIVQNKLKERFQDTLEMIFLGFIFPFLYFFILLLILGAITGSYFYFGNFIPIALVSFTLNSAVSMFLYKKTGNIVAGTVISALLITFLIITMSPPQSGLSFLGRFF
ncbi:MAG: alpha/beta hydrolase [Promethearchaeota archaeon]|nr:MAG: alpha/beta hydrolase [Candidatus Lokiarchaeota archaeon]